MTKVKEQMVVAIDGGSIEHRVALSLLLEDFLEFTGFETHVKIATEISNEHLFQMMNEFPERAEEMIETVVIDVVELTEDADEENKETIH